MIHNNYLFDTIFSSAPKNEDTYEIAIPYEESSFEQQGFFNQTDQNFEGEYHKKPLAGFNGVQTLFLLYCLSTIHFYFPF